MNKYFFIILLLILSLNRLVYAEDQSFLFKFYQNHISVVDGNRCPMYPSCSKYASESFKKHGPIIGWVMSSDRLIRCGRDEEKISGNIIIDHEKLIYDPLEANDFWWFKKEASK